MKVWPVVAGVLAGLAAGGIWTLAQPNRYRADARLLVRSSAATRITPAVEALAESNVVAANVAATLRLAAPPHVSADVSKGEIVTVSVEAEGRERARQIDAEVVSVLTQKVGQRFGRDATVVLDAAHATDRTSPTPTRNLLVAGMIGLATGVLLTPRLRGRRSAGADPHTERLLRARIDEVTKRERALARRAGELAKREAELAETTSPERQREIPEPVPALQPATAAAPAGADRPTLAELERFVDAHRDAPAERQEEWRTYLFLLREHADADGALPPSFDSLVDDVFGDAS